MDLKQIYEKYSDILIDEQVFVDIGDGWEQLISELLAATKVYQDINIGSSDFQQEDVMCFTCCKNALL